MLDSWPTQLCSLDRTGPYFLIHREKSVSTRSRLWGLETSVRKGRDCLCLSGQKETRAGLGGLDRAGLELILCPQTLGVSRTGSCTGR